MMPRKASRQSRPASLRVPPLNSALTATNVVFGAVGVQRDIGPFEHPEQFGLVGAQAGEQTVEGGEAGLAAEDAIEPRRPGRLVRRGWMAAPSLENSTDRGEGHRPDPAQKPCPADHDLQRVLGWFLPARTNAASPCSNVHPRCVGNHDYFQKTAAELEGGGYGALLHDLQVFDLDRINLRVIPKTAALLYQKERSLDLIKDWWLDRLVTGQTRRTADFWERGVETAALFEDYLNAADRVGVKRRAEETTFGQELGSWSPGLAGPTSGSTFGEVGPQESALAGPLGGARGRRPQD